MKKILKMSSIIIGFYALVILLTLGVNKCAGQINSAFKAAESLNADSTTIRNYLKADSMANRETGWLYFNNQSNKWRLGWWSTGQPIQWQNIGAGNGAGNVTGTFSSGQVPFATGAHSLTSNSTLLWDNTTKTFGIWNAGLTQNTLFSPGFISSSGIGLQLSAALNTDITAIATGTGQFNATTSGNTMSLFSTGGLGGVVSNRWNVVGAAGNQWTIDANSVNGTIGFNSVGDTGTSQLSVDNNLSINSTSAGKTLGVQFSSDINVNSTLGNITLTTPGFFIAGSGGETVNFNSITGTETITSANTASLVLHDTPSTNDLTISQSATTALINSPVNTTIQTSGDSITLNFPVPGSYWTFYEGAMGNVSAGTSISASNVLTVTAGNSGGTDDLELISNGGDVRVGANGGLFVATAAAGTAQISIGSGISTYTGDTGIALHTSTGTVTIQNGVVGPFSAYYGPAANKILDFGSTGTLGETTLTTTITGQSNGDGCHVTAPSTVGVFTCLVSGGNISVTFHNTTSGTVDPVSGTYKIQLIK